MMRLFTRLTVCAAPAMLLSALISHIADSWFGEDSSVVGACRQIVFEAQRAESLRARAKMIARARAAKCAIVEQLLAGRLRLLEAIEQFYKANELVQSVDRISTYRTPTGSQEVGRQVLLWVRSSIASWPSDKAQGLLADLESEYQTLFHGMRPKEAGRRLPMDTIPTDRTGAKSTG